MSIVIFIICVIGASLNIDDLFKSTILFSRYYYYYVNKAAEFSIPIILLLPELHSFSGRNNKEIGIGKIGNRLKKF